jgi:hypothetical protein
VTSGALQQGHTQVKSAGVKLPQCGQLARVRLLQCDQHGAVRLLLDVGVTYPHTLTPLDPPPSPLAPLCTPLLPFLTHRGCAKRRPTSSLMPSWVMKGEGSTAWMWVRLDHQVLWGTSPAPPSPAQPSTAQPSPAQPSTAQHSTGEGVRDRGRVSQLCVMWWYGGRRGWQGWCPRTGRGSTSALLGGCAFSPPAAPSWLCRAPPRNPARYGA